MNLGFAQNAVGAENQNQDQNAEGQNILVVAGEIAGGEALGQAQYKAAHHGPGDGADAAEHRRGKGLESGEEADAEVDLAHVRGDQHAAQRGQP